MKNALIAILLLLSVLLADASAAEWKGVVAVCGDPDEYESSRSVPEIGIMYLYLEFPWNMAPAARLGWQRETENRRLKDELHEVDNTDARFVGDFSGSLSFLAR
ncbi:MAG: hypothetical protein ACUVUU_09430 [bacterium]